jgi:hypothetical protein
MRYELTQTAAAHWCLLALGTYKDYEQGRAKPMPIIEYGLVRRVQDYEEDHRKRENGEQAATVAAPI